MEYIKTNAVSGWANLGAVIGNLKTSPELRWANPLELKNTVERAFSESFGAKEAAKPKAKVSAFVFEHSHANLTAVLDPITITIT